MAESFYDTLTRPNTNSYDRRTEAMQGANTSAGLAATSGLIQSGMGLYDMIRNEPKRMQLAQDQFNFERGLANRNLENQGKLVNEELMRKRGVSLAMSGMEKPAQEAYSLANPVTAVNTSAIG